MNRWLIFVLIVMVQRESLAQDEPQEPECKNRKALPFSTQLMGQLPQNWYVNRLTIMTKLPEVVETPPEKNCCSPLTYLQECKGDNPIGGIFVSREWRPNGDFIKITKSYSNRFKNIAEFWESQGISDPAQNPKLIFAGILTRMIIHVEGKKPDELKSFDFPMLILYAAAREYAIIYYQAKFEWIHYMDCDNEVSWIEISEAVVKDDRVEAINAEIDQYLNNSNIPKMELIPLVLPFQV